MILLSNVFRSLSEGETEKVVIKANPRRESAVIPSKEKVLKAQINGLEIKKKEIQAEIVSLKQFQTELSQSLLEEKEKALTSIQSMETEKMQELEKRTADTLAQAKEAGYSDGYDRGYNEGLSALSELKKKVEETLSLAYSAKENIIASSEPFLLELSTHIAKKILMDELSTDPIKIKNNIGSTLQQLTEKKAVLLQISVEDYGILQAELNELVGYLGSQAELKIVPVEGLGQGDFVIVTSNGTFDGKIDSQLQEVKRQLLSYYEETVASE
jgi:flagellar assembly protein FliH